MKKAILYEKFDNGIIRCKLCAHYCKIKVNRIGICGVKQNIDGELYSLNYGKVEGLAIDPIEKKPFYHFIPGQQVLSFGLPGCNFRCTNCQNSYLSQHIKQYVETFEKIDTIPPELIIQSAIQHDIKGIAYTYSEPIIFFEYAYDIIKNCRKEQETQHLKQMFVSNGYFSRELRDLIIAENLLDAVNIDLKFMNDRKYRRITGGTLSPVLDNIEAFANSNIHLEIINLVIPGENDNDEDFNLLADFLSSVDKNIPLHFSRFFPHYKMNDRSPTTVERLLKAKETARNYGIKYVYLGNVNIEGASNTYCPQCGTLLIERRGYDTRFHDILLKNDEYFCKKCKTKINCIG